MTNRTYDAILERAFWSPNEIYQGRLCGDVYGDTKGRFTDGEDIYTNIVVACSYFEGKTIFKTKSGTRYLVNSWKPIPEEEPTYE